jgi:predicted transcriptional regulator
MSEKQSRTISDDMETTKERHRRYLMAMNNPVRRRIVRSIQNGDENLVDLMKATGLDEKTLDWHLKILEHGYCIEKKMYNDVIHFEVTREGKVIDFLDK